MSKIIEIIIAPTGESRVETKGFVGSECREASRFIEQALGQQTEEHLTSEFYTTGQTETRQTHDQ